MTQYKYVQVSKFNKPPLDIIGTAEKFTEAYLSLLEKYNVIPSEDSDEDTISFYLGEMNEHSYFLEMSWGDVIPNSLHPIKEAIPSMKIVIIDYGDFELDITCGKLVKNITCGELEAKNDTNSI